MGVEIFLNKFKHPPYPSSESFSHSLCTSRDTKLQPCERSKVQIHFSLLISCPEKRYPKNFNHGSPCNLSWCCRCDSCSGYKGKLIKKCTYSADTLHNVTSQVHNVTAQVESILLKGKKKQHSRSRRDLNNVKKGLSQWLGCKIQRWYF